VWDVVKTYWPLIATGVSLISLVIQTLLVKTYAKREDVQALRDRVISVEQRVADMPGKEDLHKLQLEISELRGDIREVRPDLAQVRRISDLLLENELNGAKS
jgi:NhaP-type Na+/H+ and K+/H+ antiporter